MSRLFLATLLATTSPLLELPAAFAAPVTFERLVAASQVPYTGELVVNGKTVLRVTHGPGDRRRNEVLAPVGMRGEVIVDNGKTRWHHSPRTSQVDIAPSEMGYKRPIMSARLMERNFKLHVIRQDKVAGRSVTVVDILPRHAGRPSQRLWMDQATGLPLRVERRSPQGTLLGRSEFRSIEFPAKLPADAFEFALPPRARVSSSVQMIATGSTIADLKTPVPFPIKMPSYLPAGFEVVTVHLFENKGVRSVHWRLSDGLDMLSLFQTDRANKAQRPPGAHDVAIANSQGFIVGQGSHHMLCWDTPNGAFTLVGDLTEAELTRIAASTTTQRK